MVEAFQSAVAAHVLAMIERSRLCTVRHGVWQAIVALLPQRPDQLRSLCVGHDPSYLW